MYKQIINTVSMDDNNYLMMVGQINPQADMIIRYLELPEIIRFRDAGYNAHSKTFWILARTGSTNHFKAHNNDLKSHPSYESSEDDPFDSTYEVLTFKGSGSGFKHYSFIGLEQLIKKMGERHARGESNEYERNFIKKIKSL